MESDISVVDVDVLEPLGHAGWTNWETFLEPLVMGAGDDRRTWAVGGLDDCRRGVEVSRGTAVNGLLVPMTPFVFCFKDGDIDRLGNGFANGEKGLGMADEVEKGFFAGACVFMWLL